MMSDQFPFDEGFEHKLLARLIRDGEFFRQHSLIKESYFQSAANQLIFELARKYHEKYTDPMTLGILKNEITKHFEDRKKPSESDEVYNQKYELHIEVAERLFVIDLSTGEQYASDVVVGFCRRKELEREILNAADRLVKGHNLIDPKTGKAFSDRIKDIETMGVEIKSIEDQLPTFDDIDENVTEDWLIEGILPRQAIIVEYGKRGLGKSHVTYHAAKHVAEGEDWLGLKVKQCPVYYIDRENPPVVRAHIKKICGGSCVRYWGLDSELGIPPRLDSPQWEIYKTLSPGLIIFDTLRAFVEKDTTNDTDMAIVMNRLKELWAMGHTVVILLHTLKANDRMWKGNTVILDLADHTLALFRVKSQGEITEDETEEDPNKPKLLFLGCLPDEKSRFRKASIYLNFDPAVGINSAGDPDAPTLRQLHQRFVDWVENEQKSKGRKLELAEYPNRDGFEQMIVAWGFTQNKARKLIPKGFSLGYWGMQEMKSKGQPHHHYYPNLKRLIKDKSEV
jgi:hypothetical protein